MVLAGPNDTVEVVVVGVDGSPSAAQAVAYAAGDAARRGAQLRLVHAFSWPYLHAPLGPAPGAPAEAGLQHQAERIVSEARDHAAAAVAEMPGADVKIDAQLVTGFPTAVLIAESGRASMVIVGNRGLGGFTGLLLGSTAAQLIAHSHSPVTVVRDEVDRGGKVVVGIDGSTTSRVALAFACEEAERRGCGVEAVSVWSHPRPHSPGDVLPLVYEPAAVEHEARAVLVEALTPARAAHSGISITEQLIRGRTRRNLIDCSAHASVLVVGRHTREFGSLGSVAAAVTHRAHCPVVVVPAARATTS